MLTVDQFDEIAVTTFYSVVGAGKVVFYSLVTTSLLHAKSGLLSSLRSPSTNICVLKIIKNWLTFLRCHILQKLESSGDVLYEQKCCCEKHSSKFAKTKVIDVIVSIARRLNMSPDAVTHMEKKTTFEHSDG